jgi:D-arabinose 5-phosphate isomerase GutQ
MNTSLTPNDLKTLAIKLAAVTDRVESRLQQVSAQTLTASQSMVQQSHDAQKAASDMARDALAQFRQAASAQFARACAAQPSA